MPAAPTPFHSFRHSYPLATLAFSLDNSLLYGGDQDGYVSVLDLRARRVVGWWKAHQGGVLGVSEWEGGVVSHGRDNMLHFHEPLKKSYIPISTSVLASRSDGEAPPIMNSMPTNSLNFCRFSLVSLPGSASSGAGGKGKEKQGFMAVPGLVDSELIDIYHIPSMRRLHASINLASRPPPPPPSELDLPGVSRSGLVMSLHLFFPPSFGDARDQLEKQIGLVAAYEDGRVELFSAPVSSLDQQYDARLSQRPNPWTLLWSGKGHNEAVMAAAVDSTGRRAWSVSADHLLVRYELGEVWRGKARKDDTGVIKSFATKQIGHSSIAVSSDDKVVAVGGWDGKIRLFSAATSKPLGTLSSHRGNVHAIAFANSPTLISSSDTDKSEDQDAESTVDLREEDSDDDRDETENGVPPRERWLASGGKEGKVALWGLMDFAAGSSQ